MSGHRIVIGLFAAGVALALAAAIPAASGPAGPASAPFVRFAAPANVVEQLSSVSLGVSKHDGAAYPALPGGRVRVVVQSKDPVATRAAVVAAGGRVERAQGGLVQAAVPRSAVAGLERRGSTELVRPPMRMIPDAVNGEEVAGSLASDWQAKGFTGKGVKIAIIDGGFVGLADRQAAGDLPTNVVTQDFCAGQFATATEHGTAVAEIVHEMAPDAQLYLACITTDVDFAAAEAWAKGQGVQIISHSASWFGAYRGDGSGPIGAAVADARAAGILWVNSAGNYAQTHWSGTFTSADGDRWHDFAPGDEGQSFVWPNNATICGFLRWDEWPAGRSDYDLVLFLSGANLALADSSGDQTGSQPPVEGLCAKQTTGGDLPVFWAIYGYNTPTTPRMDLFGFSPSFQYQTAAGSLLDPATSPAALTAGAVCWQSKQLEPYSSQGPTIDGRMKPEISGHDSVSSATYGGFSACGQSGFAGTSASAPEVAGAAALVKQAFPSYTPDQLQQFLQTRALDLGTPGADNATGAGELQLGKPPDIVPPTGKALPSSGKAGRIVKLLSAVADDQGQVSVVEQVKRNGSVVKTIKRPGTVAATSPRTVSVGWKAPAKPKGSYQHCVVATDAAGNKSPESCAKVTIR